MSEPARPLPDDMIETEDGDLVVMAMSYASLGLLQLTRPDAHELVQGPVRTGYAWPPALPWDPATTPNDNFIKAMVLLRAELGLLDVPEFPDQEEIHSWSLANFGESTHGRPESLIGWVEELFELQTAINRWYESWGRLHRAVNKQVQGVRGDHASWEEEIKKELGDVFIKGCDVVARFGFDWAELAAERWKKVSTRNATGHTPVSEVALENPA